MKDRPIGLKGQHAPLRRGSELLQREERDAR